MAIGVAVADAPPASAPKSMARPPNGSLSFMTDIVSPFLYPPRVCPGSPGPAPLQRLERRDHLRDRGDPLGVVHLGHGDDDVLRAGVGELPEPVDELGRGLCPPPATLTRQVHVLQRGAL